MPFLRAAEPAGLRQVHDKSLRRDEKEEGVFSPADLADLPFPRRIPALPPHPVLCFSPKSKEPPSPSQGDAGVPSESRLARSIPAGSPVNEAGASGR